MCFEGHEVTEIESSGVFEAFQNVVRRADEPQVYILGGSCALEAKLEDEAAFQDHRVCEDGRDPGEEPIEDEELAATSQMDSGGGAGAQSLLERRLEGGWRCILPTRHFEAPRSALSFCCCDLERSASGGGGGGGGGAGVGDSVLFYHGGRTPGLQNIVDNGIQPVSVNTHAHPPGSFFTYAADAASTHPSFTALNAATHMGGRSTGLATTGRVGVLEMSVPRSTVNQLLEQGLMKTGPTPKFSSFPNETVFHPDALPQLNKSARFRFVKPQY